MPPMGDASSVDPSMGADPMMPPTDGQNIGAGEGMEPSDGMGAEPTPDEMGGEPMPDDMGGTPEGGEAMDDKVKEITDISSEANDEGKEAILNYARSVKDNGSNSSQGQQEPDMSGEEPMPDGGGMPMESVIFTKGQLRRINESLGAGMDDERDDKKLTRRTNKTIQKVKSSPFNSPRFK